MAMRSRKLIQADQIWLKPLRLIATSEGQWRNQAHITPLEPQRRGVIAVTLDFFFAPAGESDQLLDKHEKIQSRAYSFDV